MIRIETIPSPQVTAKKIRDWLVRSEGALFQRHISALAAEKAAMAANILLDKNNQNAAEESEALLNEARLYNEMNLTMDRMKTESYNFPTSTLHSNVNSTNQPT